MPKILKSGVLLAIGAVFGIVVMTAKHEVSCDKGEPLAMNGEMLNCPEGSTARWEHWGGLVKQGWAHYCQMNHGTYHVWIDNQLYIDGEFRFGEKTGEWSIRNENDDTVLKQHYEPSNRTPTSNNGGSD